MDNHIMVCLSHTSLHSISYYPLHGTDTNLYIPGTRPEALTTSQVYPFFNGQVSCLEQFFHDTTACVTLSHVVLHFNLHCKCLASNRNYCAGL